MKRCISIFTAITMMLFIFCSCSSQDNCGNTMSVNAGDKVPVSQVYDGYEDLQGKSFGNLKMPDKIEKPEFEKLCRFPDRRGGEKISEEKETAVSIFGSIFGENFDEKYIETDSKTGDIYYRSSEGSAVVYNGFPFNITLGYTGDILTPDRKLTGSYSPSDTDKTVRLKDGDCTVGELLSGMQKCLEKDILPYMEDYEVRPLSVLNYCADETNCSAEITYGVSYKGIMLEEASPLFEIKDAAGYQTLTTYTQSSLTLFTDNKDRYLIFTPSFSQQQPKPEEVSEAISLRAAVEILKNELAENLRLDFDSVELRYCCKTTGPVMTADESENSRVLAEYGEIKAAYFEPTWCFYYSVRDLNGSHCEAVKVNAITGEITIDK